MEMVYFAWNERLHISLPVLQYDWNCYSMSQQADIIAQWESIRGAIPQQIFAFESIINRKQEQLFEEDDFERSCELNYEIADYASRINDLHLWYRLNQELDSRRHS